MVDKSVLMAQYGMSEEKAEQFLADQKAREDAAKRSKLKLKVSTKSGCISLFGMRKFPVSFHPNEWRLLFEAKQVSDILAICDKIDKDETDGVEFYTPQTV